MTKHEQKSLTGPRWPSKTIHRSLVDHLPQEEQEGSAEGLGRFKPLIRLSGLHEGLVRALRADHSELSRVLDGQLRAARERSLSTRLGLLCYEALVHNAGRDRWHLGYRAYGIPKMIRSRGLFHPIPHGSTYQEHAQWQAEAATHGTSSAVTATFGWMVAAGQRNERTAHWVRVLRLFEQQARAEARAHLFRTVPEERFPPLALGARFRPAPSDWEGFKPTGAEMGRVGLEVLDCLHLRAFNEIRNDGTEALVWRGSWNQKVKGRGLGALLVRRLNRMWARLHGPSMSIHHGTAVGGRPALRALSQRALDDGAVRTSYLKLGLRLGAITLRKLRGIDAVGLWMQKPVVQSALRYEEKFHVPDEAEARLKACKRYLERAEHSRNTLDEERRMLLDTTASSLTPKGKHNPKQWVRFREGFKAWEIHEEGQSRNDFLKEQEQWLQLIWHLKEEASRQHHAHVLESEPPHLDEDMIDPS